MYSGNVAVVIINYMYVTNYEEKEKYVKKKYIIS